MLYRRPFLDLFSARFGERGVLSVFCWGSLVSEHMADRLSTSTPSVKTDKPVPCELNSGVLRLVSLVSAMCVVGLLHQSHEEEGCVVILQENVPHEW